MRPRVAALNSSLPCETEALNQAEAQLEREIGAGRPRDDTPHAKPPRRRARPGAATPYRAERDQASRATDTYAPTPIASGRWTPRPCGD